MDYGSNVCNTCGETDIDYDLSNYNTCLTCYSHNNNTNNISATFGYESGVNFRSLQKVKLNKKRKLPKITAKKNHLRNMKPFKLEDMFNWIFEKQIEAMRSLVKDFDKFRDFSRCLWTIYLKSTGCEFDIIESSAEELKSQKYPLGWGLPLDPNKVKETLVILSEVSQDESESDPIELKRKRKKRKIEMMVEAKYDNKENEDNDDQNSDESKENSSTDENDPPASAKNKKKKKAVKILGKKKECDVKYVGSRNLKSSQHLMENNIILLFYTLHFTRLGTTSCCCLLDLWRLAKKGVIPYLKISRILPVEEYFIPHTAFQSIILRDKMPSFGEFKQYMLLLAETLSFDTFLMPDNSNVIVRRMLHEFNLPWCLSLVINYIRSAVEIKVDKYYKLKKGSNIIKTNSEWLRFKRMSLHVLEPELCCLGYIFIALRLLLKLDGEFEINVSSLATELEAIGPLFKYGGFEVRPLFVWTRWMKEMRRPPSLSTAKTWRDLGEVRTAKEFLEQEDQDEEDECVNYVVDYRVRHEDKLVNQNGRFVQRSKLGTHDGVLIDIVKSLSLKLPPNVTEKAEKTDFTNSCIDYLSAPFSFKKDVEEAQKIAERNKLLIGESKELKAMRRETMGRLIGAVGAGGPNNLMRWRQLGVNCRRYPRGVFHNMVAKEGMTTAEIDLMDVLLYNTGIDCDLFHHTVDSLSHIFFNK